MKTICFLILCLGFASCGQDNFDKYSELKGLRLLAIQADTPEINAAGTVTLTPYLSYPKGGDTTLDITVEGCPDPGIGYGAKVSCKGVASALKFTDSTTFSTATLGSAAYYTGAMNPIAVTVPGAAFALLSQLDSNVRYNGLGYIVILTIKDQNSSKAIKAYKSINLTTRITLNTNPVIGGTIQADGEDLALGYPRSKVKLQLTGVSAAEDYELRTADGSESLTETLTVSWFSNKGEFTLTRADPDKKVEYDPSGKEAVVVAVLRDNRGGVDVLTVVAP